jgi:hypothetical protein
VKCGPWQADEKSPFVMLGKIGQQVTRQQCDPLKDTKRHETEGFGSSYFV